MQGVKATCLVRLPRTGAGRRGGRRGPGDGDADDLGSLDREARLVRRKTDPRGCCSPVQGWSSRAQALEAQEGPCLAPCWIMEDHEGHQGGRGRVGRSLQGRTYRKDFMSKPRFRICPTTWSQLPGLERLRPPAARYLEPAEAACRAGPRPWARGLVLGTAAAWACSWPRLWLVVGWPGCRPRWCWLRGCCKLCCRVRVRGRWHLGSPVELGIDSRVVAVDRVESSKLGVDGGRRERRSR